MTRDGAALLAFLAVFGGCARHATVTECDALLDRYVELLVHEQNPKADEAEMGRQKAATHEKAAHDPSFASCPKEVSAKSARCAMEAPSVDEFERCLVTLD
jgi:hypothetical protein